MARAVDVMFGEAEGKANSTVPVVGSVRSDSQALVSPLVWMSGELLTSFPKKGGRVSHSVLDPDR